MSLTGTDADAPEHIDMPGDPTAEIQAISAKVGAAASPSQPDTSDACPTNEAAIPFAANILISGSPLERLRCEDAISGGGPGGSYKCDGISAGRKRTGSRSPDRVQNGRNG
ncbi:hypothetical protein GCM10010862_23840 [Devosia nitrariae]|uniref:Uncharacterized protein n=1 Tax=Devosia nitrariae TaxID=2071872 RepID=A0ABQ5W5B5_9HYPH|nr:hypothetical protein GCM10010862_23840 [Devosia nitrariae]